MFKKNSRSLNDPVVRDRNKEIRNLAVKRFATTVGVVALTVGALHVATKVLENHNEQNDN